ncbi:hypothetical protein [Halocatena salina]|uniref:Uncharacterized protein n=1 Tax=Halocatena salina TaxID=2934340 RepID=A0A8U0A0L5_9EURY|nr:hypothetical protein [Halocatena salina]UPM42650.1 hypothetical protein MW046_11885 [Halocatena salina]
MHFKFITALLLRTIEIHCSLSEIGVDLSDDPRPTLLTQLIADYHNGLIRGGS